MADWDEEEFKVWEEEGKRLKAEGWVLSRRFGPEGRIHDFAKKGEVEVDRTPSYRLRKGRKE